MSSGNGWVARFGSFVPVSKYNTMHADTGEGEKEVVAVAVVVVGKVIPATTRKAMCGWGMGRSISQTARRPHFDDRRRASL